MARRGNENARETSRIGGKIQRDDAQFPRGAKQRRVYQSSIESGTNIGKRRENITRNWKERKKMLLARENSSSNSSNDNTDADNPRDADVNDPVTREQFFKARVKKEDDELIVFAVGDTRDHRRVTKDPAIATIGTDFVANVALNLKAMGIEHYICSMAEFKEAMRIH